MRNTPHWFDEYWERAARRARAIWDRVERRGFRWY